MPSVTHPVEWEEAGLTWPRAHRPRKREPRLTPILDNKIVGNGIGGRHISLPEVPAELREPIFHDPQIRCPDRPFFRRVHSGQAMLRTANIDIGASSFDPDVQFP